MANAFSELWSGVTGAPSGIKSIVNTGKTQYYNATGQQVPGYNTSVAQLAASAKAATPSPAVAQATPNNVYGGNPGSTAATGGTSAAGSQADIATYQDQLNSLQQLLSGADTSLNNGQNDINTGYSNALAQLGGQHQNLTNQYNTQHQNTEQDYSKNIQRINTNARQGYNSLQALLGGSGSAGDVLAPFAVSQQANSQRGASADAYAKNLKAIADAQAAADLNYETQKKGKQDEHDSALRNLIASINQQKMGYQQQIGSTQNQLNIAKGGSYATPKASNDAITALLAQNANLGSQYKAPTYSVQDYVPQETNLADYQSQAARLAGSNNVPDANGADDTATALAQLLKKQQPDTSYSY